MPTIRGWKRWRVELCCVEKSGAAAGARTTSWRRSSTRPPGRTSARRPRRPSRTSTRRTRPRDHQEDHQEDRQEDHQQDHQEPGRSTTRPPRTSTRTPSRASTTPVARTTTSSCERWMTRGWGGGMGEKSHSLSNFLRGGGPQWNNFGSIKTSSFSLFGNLDG